MAEIKLNYDEKELENESLIKEDEEEEGRQLFANKKANIALIIVAAVVVIGFAAAFVWANM